MQGWFLHLWDDGGLPAEPSTTPRSSSLPTGSARRSTPIVSGSRTGRRAVRAAPTLGERRPSLVKAADLQRPVAVTLWWWSFTIGWSISPYGRRTPSRLLHLMYVRYTHKGRQKMGCADDDRLSATEKAQVTNRQNLLKQLQRWLQQAAFDQPAR